jgi:hypothetical protein
MKRLFVTYMVVLLSSSIFALGEVDPVAVRKIVVAELAAMKLPINSPVCLALLPARNTSETGGDPSPQLTWIPGTERDESTRGINLL